jgi:hypothetical protein
MTISDFHPILIEPDLDISDNKAGPETCGESGDVNRRGICMTKTQPDWKRPHGAEAGLPPATAQKRAGDSAPAMTLRCGNKQFRLYQNDCEQT